MKKNVYQNSFVICLTAILLATNVSAQNYFVDPLNGNNNNNGTSVNQAWLTIQKGVESIPGGATLILKGGTYFGKVTVPTSCNGTAARPTTIKSLDGETAIIDGSNSGTQWEGLLSLSGGQYITFEGIKVQNGFWYGINIANSNNILIDGCQTFNTRASGIYVIRGSLLTIINSNVRKACQGNVRDANGNGTQECISIVASFDFKVTKNEIWDSTVGGSAGGEGLHQSASQNEVVLCVCDPIIFYCLRWSRARCSRSMRLRRIIRSRRYATSFLIRRAAPPISSRARLEPS